MDMQMPGPGPALAQVTPAHSWLSTCLPGQGMWGAAQALLPSGSSPARTRGVPACRGQQKSPGVPAEAHEVGGAWARAGRGQGTCWPRSRSQKQPNPVSPGAKASPGPCRPSILGQLSPHTSHPSAAWLLALCPWHRVGSQDPGGPCPESDNADTCDTRVRAVSLCPGGPDCASPWEGIPQPGVGGWAVDRDDRQ